MIYDTANIEGIIARFRTLQSLEPLKPEDAQRLARKFRLEFNYNSNHIEGNTLTYGQTQLLLIYGKSSGDVPLSDLQEMKAHDVALAQIQEMAGDQDRPLTEQFIKELNKTILVESFWKEAITPDGQTTQRKIEIGVYKSQPNSVRLKNGELHEYTAPGDTPAKMHELMDWYNAHRNILHPVQLAAEFHYRFVCIHPFDDGNGRVARLVMNYILYRNHYPPVIIKSHDKEQYLTALQRADTGDLMAIVEYVERQMLWSLDISVKAAQGENIDELEDVDKEIAILKREKLTAATLYKTPKVAFQLIRHIENDIWKPLDNLLTKFDDFFGETSVSEFFNQERIEPAQMAHRDATDSLTEKEGSGKTYELMGHDLSSEDVTHIYWEKNMLSLKSSFGRDDIKIAIHLQLETDSYLLKITESNKPGENLREWKGTSIFSQQKTYKSFFMKDEVDAIIRLVSAHMITMLKERG